MPSDKIDTMEFAMSLEKISVIIPVYKVEQYLDRCVKSVLEQSYTNLEIFLVDDGSPDSCGAMCDQWAEKEPRIRVIHKENGGLSDARNAGLDAATGEYIVFIDSDDYIAADMIQNLYRALKENDADMSICNFCYVDENGSLLAEESQGSPLEDEVLTGPEAIAKEADYLHKGWYYIFTWNKLYKKCLFHDVRFPKGKLSEDDYTAHRVFQQCKRIATIRYVGYYYVQRGGSIIHNRSRFLFLHRAEGRLERAKLCYDLGLKESAGQTYWLAAMALPNAFRKDTSPEVIREQKSVLQKYRRQIWMRKYCPKKKRIQLLLMYLSPNLYRAVLRNPIRQQMKGRPIEPEDLKISNQT